MADETLPTPLVAVPAAVKTLDQFALAALAREIAMDIRPRTEVLAQYNLTPEQYETVKIIPYFALLLENEIKAWQSAVNTPERVRIEAAAMFEQWMPTLFARMQNTQENLAQVVEGGKLVAKVAGIGERAGGDAGGGFAITINVGKDTVKVLTAPVIEGEVA